MLRCPGLPLLPGTVFRDITKTKYHKSQHWAYCGNVPVLAEAIRPGIGGVPIKNPDDPPHQLPSFYPPYLGPIIPPWLAYDKKILGFYAYFKETLQEVYQSAYQVRNVKIIFFLEDGTLMITEPKTDNSGIPQGCLVSRQRIPRPAPCQNEFISLLDLNVNKPVRIYDRVYHIIGCDKFTRKFLNRLGIHVPDNVNSPPDPGTELRKEIAKTKQPKKPSIHIDTLAQFLEYDRKVLKFSAYWDDRSSQFGDIRNLEIYYFLSDDTIQIKEILEKNSGRDTGGMFLKRTKIAKDFTGLPDLGQNTQFTVLNVLGGGVKGGRYIPDSLNVGNRVQEFYTDRDITLGTTISVMNRAIVITGCDQFTKEYYRKKYGLENFSVISKPETGEKCFYPIDINLRELPPFNGWGSYEDSEGNCKTVEPKPPKADFMKFIHLDRYLLRFGARMVSIFKENCDRIFIVTYYLSDDTISVHELAVRNSGFLGGDFFKRAKFVLPNQEVFTSNRPLTFKPQDFYIGAVITLRDHKFYLISADEFALCYMENKHNEFPFANPDSIMNKIREAIRPIYKDFIAKYMTRVCNISKESQCYMVLRHEDLKDMLIELLQTNIVDHEIITICRHFSAEHKLPIACDREKVRSAVHMEIKRELWDKIERLKEHFYHIDPEQHEFLPENKIMSAIRAVKLPFDIELTKSMFSVLHKNNKLEISLPDFYNFINIHLPSCPIPPLNIKHDVCPDLPFTTRGRLIDWECFINHLGLEENLKKEAD